MRALDPRRLLLSLRLDARAVGTAESDLLKHRLVIVPGGDTDEAAEASVHVLRRELALAERDTAERWAAAENASGRHHCACGCGSVIAVLPVHRLRGLPRFIHGHHKMAMTAFVEQLNAEGYLTVSQAAEKLGVSENTLRRAEMKGLVKPEWRAWGQRQPMRVYRLTSYSRATVVTGRDR